MTDASTPDASPDAVERFISRWQTAGGTERANYQLLLTDLGVLLDLPTPDPASDDTRDNAYVFERRVHFQHGDGTESFGFIEDGIAARFTGRGAWRRRLPQLLEMLTALGRARELPGGRYAGLAYPVVSTDPNRLRSLWSGNVPSPANLLIRRGGATCPEAEQGLKGGHRLAPPIVAKHELVQVDLQLRLTDPVVRADQPLLQVADGAVGQRHDGGRASAESRLDRLRTPYVSDVGSLQVLEPFQAVGMDRGARADVGLDERGHRRLFEIRDHGHPDTPARFPTATTTMAAFRPFNCRLPRTPACGPPTQVSSISTSPCSGSRVALTIARRSLCNNIHAVSYRRSPSCRWRRSAEIPRLSVVIRYAAQNQTVSGSLVLWRIVPAVNETWYRQATHRHRRCVSIG
jgi:hypothetical protein